MKILKTLKKSAVVTVCCTMVYTACMPLFNGNPGMSVIYAEPDMPASSASGNCGKDVKWNYNDATKVLSIEGTGEMYDYTGYNSLPWNSVADGVKEIKVGEGVTKIGRFALAGFKNVTSVSLPLSLKTIDFNAFYLCPSLTEIYMYDKVEEMNITAFTYCDKLKEIVLNISESTTVTADGTGSFSLPQELVDKGVRISRIFTQDGIEIKNESGNDITVNGIKIAAGTSYPHTHNFSSEYETSPEGHARLCGCGAVSLTEEHEYALLSDTKDEKVYKCNVCGYEKKEATSNSKTGNAGNIGHMGNVYYICLFAGVIITLICALGIILLNSKKRELQRRIMKRKKRMSADSQD